ncbi:MurPQ operon repressor [Cedecea neteri]|uniref:MurPQ operon repressor n=1 Tax=Cedecea neteri TaxID=158822 RepID=A0A2X3J8Z7_9ENTR|nr:MurPQ operon repressor [Cedecea neteri]
MKLAISEALASGQNPNSVPVHNQILGDDPLRLVGEKLIKENIAAMHATLDINAEEKLLASVSLLRNARRVLLVGIGASGLVAKNFSWKLMKIGIHAVAEQDMHALLATVQAMTPEDVLLAISYSASAGRSTWPPMKRLTPGRKSSRLPASRLTLCSNAPACVSTPSQRNRLRVARPSPPPAPR